MRKLSLLLCAVLAAFLVLPMIAQAPNTAIVRVGVYKVKSGMAAQFEAGLKKHNDFHARQKDSKGIETWVVQSGENTGSYLRIVTGPNWADYDKPTYNTAADEADSATNITPYVDSDMQEWWRFLGDVSHGPAGAGPSPMSSVLFFRIKIGHVQEFMTAIKKITEAARKTSWPVNYYWYRLENGGEHPTFALVLPRKNFADFEEPAVTFAAMMEKTFGRAETDTIIQGLDRSIAGQHSQMISYRADLSYTPAK